jgi:hypothetical protein
MARVWDVSMGPFKKTTVGGVLVPNALSPVQFLRWSRRRIALELYGDASGPGGIGPIGDDDGGGGASSSANKFPLADSDVLYLRIYKPDRQARKKRRRFRLGGGGRGAAHAAEDEEDDASAVDTDDDDASLVSTILHADTRTCIYICVSDLLGPVCGDDKAFAQRYQIQSLAQTLCSISHGLSSLPVAVF